MISKRRVITVPKDAAAQEALDTDSAVPASLIELELSVDDFAILQAEGIFDSINHWAEANIDDFESESITEPNLIAKVQTQLGSLAPPRPAVAKLVGAMGSLFGEALRRKTGVFFYF